MMARIVFLLLAVSAAASAWAEPIRLTYSNFFPPTHVQSKLAEEWCQEVARRTGGAVVIDYYPGGTLTKPQNAYDGVVEGISDIAMSAFAYTKGRFPLLSGLDLPLGYPTGALATRVANEALARFAPKEVNDVHVLYLHAHGPGILHTVAKPVTRLEDVSGLKIRATGSSAAVVAALGASPVAMPMNDAYQALQKRVVDGSMYPVETNKGWKMAEVVDFMIDTRATAYTTVFFVAMNKAAWDRIPVEHQRTITALCQEWAAKHGAAWDESDREGRKFFLEKGKKIITLSAEEDGRWRAAMEPVLAQYIEACQKAGLDGAGLVSFVQERLR
jgi:TRAP-type C4-dicarboxylate transport system substrate-binding protein